MSTVDHLRRLARQPLWRRWTLASFLARLPNTMSLLALVLVGEAVTGSVAVGAQLAGVATVVTGLAAPLRGRWLDRGELRSGLQRHSLLAAAVLAAEGAAVLAGAPLVVLFALAVGHGFAFAALSGGYRALLGAVVPGQDLERANTLEAVFIEVAFVAGPALAGLLALVLHPGGVLLVMAASAAASAVVTRGLPACETAFDPTAAAPWRAPGVRPVFLLALGLGLAVGLFEASLPARATELGMVAASAGWMLALVSAGSGLGGLVAVSRDTRHGSVRVEAALLLAAIGVLWVPVGLLGSVPLLAVALFAAGLPIAPLNALGALTLQLRLPRGRLAEGFALYTAAIMLGAGLGHSVAGQLLDVVGARPLLLASAALPLVFAGVVAVWRGHAPPLPGAPPTADAGRPAQ